MLFNPVYKNDRTGMAVYAPIKDVVPIKPADSSPKGENPFYAKTKGLPFNSKKENPFYVGKINW